MMKYLCVLLFAVAIHAQSSVNSETDVQSVLNVQVPDPKAVVPDPKTVVPDPKAVVPDPKTVVADAKTVLPDPKSVVAKVSAEAPKATGIPTNIPPSSLPNTQSLGSLPNPFGAARLPSINTPNISPLGPPKPANPCDAIICEDKHTCVAQGDRGVCIESTAAAAAGAAIPRVEASKPVNQVAGNAPTVDLDAAASGAASVPKVLASAPRTPIAGPPGDVQLPAGVAPKALVPKTIESVPLPKAVDGIPHLNVPETPTVVLSCDKLSCEDEEKCEVRRGQAVCVPNASEEESEPSTPKVTVPTTVAPVEPQGGVVAKAVGKPNRGGNPCEVTQCAPDRTCVFENGQTACVPKVAVDANASADVKATSS